MKNPRTWNRRDFNVTPNGYFTVLKPAGWFAASRLPGGFRYLVGQAGAKVSPRPASAARQITSGGSETTLRLEVMEPIAHDHPLMRPALIVVTAVAITSFLLWWIMLKP